MITLCLQSFTGAFSAQTMYGILQTFDSDLGLSTAESPKTVRCPLDLSVGDKFR